MHRPSEAQPPRAALGASLAITVVAAACHAPPKSEAIPTEKVHVVRVASAPALSEARPGAPADRSVRWGEAYHVRGRQPDFKWAGPFEGRNEQRTGLVEVARGLDDAPRHAFADDFLEADLPTTPWLCERLPLGPISPRACADGLRRTVPSERALLAYVPCWQAACPLAELQGGAVTGTTIPGLEDLRVVALDKRPVVLAWSHAIHERGHRSSSLVVMLVDPPLQRAGEIRIGETDAREPGKVVYLLGGLEIRDDGLRFRGRRTTRDARSNQELSGAAVDETWTVGAEGKLVAK